MLDILFLSRIIPQGIENEVRNNLINSMNDAANVWQKHVIMGLDVNLEKPVKLLNFLPIASYPGNYKKAFVNSFNFAHCHGAIDKNIGFCNIVFIKRIFQGKLLYKEVLSWAKEDSKNEKIIIVYTLYPEFMRAVELAKKYNPRIKTCVIVLDLPKYTILTKNIDILSRIYLRWSSFIAKQRIKYFDCFILLTRQMASALKITQPFIVLEGISSVEFPKTNYNVKKMYKNIFYAGTLHERFGILRLVEAFKVINRKDYRLVICGFGDSQKEIEKAAKINKNIIFMGQLKREDVLLELMHASVIVNPRLNDEEFVKYSFPSKNIEALSSGIPFIGYKLDGIPDEYDQFINYPTDISMQSLASLIVSVCEDNKGIYLEKARNAKKWVVAEKSPDKQAAKILGLIKEIKRD